MAHIWLRDDGFLIIECEYAERDAVKQIGGRWDAVQRAWMVNFTTDNLESLIDSFPSATLSSSIEQKLKDREEKEAQLARLRDMSKQDIPVRLNVPGMKFPEGKGFYNYQKLGVVYAVTNGEGVLIADEMGLGKTLQAMAAALVRKAQGLAKNCLVITPAGLKWNWAIEIQKFTDEKFVVIDGDPEDRIAQWMRTDVFFHVVNYELLLEDLFGGRELKKQPNESEEKRLKREERIAKAKMRQRVLGEVRRRMWDVIIVDECHAIKSYSKRSSNVKYMRGRFRMGLTGTPMDGRLEELHSVMEFVSPGLLESRTRFIQKHADVDFWGKIVGYKNIDDVRKRIASCFLRRLKKDVLADLPPKVYENRMVVMSAEEKKTYDELASCGHAATEEVSAMVAIIRCKQFCDHPQLIGEAYQSSKLKALKAILEEVIVENGHKVLVFSQYKQMLELLVSLFDSLGLKYLRIDGDTPKQDRASMQEQFNTSSSLDLMVGTEAMSTGLNFTAADYVINYDDNWSPAIMDQRSDRAHRIGQKSTVTVVNFICKDTIEERIRQVLFGKSIITAETMGDDVDKMVLARLGPKDVAKLL